MSQTRRLAAVLAADVAGYSRLIGADEGGPLQGLKTIQTELMDPKIAAHRGRIVKNTGYDLADGEVLCSPTGGSRFGAGTRICSKYPTIAGHQWRESNLA